ncbi:unnamed protein product [Linum trigynum]|uniref:VQ domain-containing protein n=1 Tax=Linum trigynum TaxID=586398 RepID=A0AAV2DEI7_9ROSI
MASSSENLSLFDSWNFRPTFPDPWISEAYARDTDALTRALQQSLSSSLPPPPPPLDYSAAAAGGEDSLINSLLPTNFAGTTSNPDTPTPISCSSDPDSAPAPAPKPRRNTNSTTTSSAAPGATGKVTKRKSRAASKKSQTTFITADPANFRQMVQQVTGGVRFTDAMVPVLKPEPHRLGRGGSIQLQQQHVAAAAGGGGGGGGGGLLPTLDTSAFLLDHHRQIQQQQQQQTVSVSVTPGGGGGPEGPMSFSQALVGDGPDGGAGLDFGTFSNFPTLESWKVI